MQNSYIEDIATQLLAVRYDLTKFMSLISSLSAEWVEMRHSPPIEELDGFRTRDDFVAYMMHEAEFFPKTFNAIKVNATTRVEEDYIAIEPLSFSGTLVGQERHVDIRYRLTLHFESGQVRKITGQLLRENIRDDVIAWMKVIDSLGGLGQTRAFTQINAA